MESLHGSQLRKRPKFWALIEASTERRSKDIINQSSSSESLEPPAKYRDKTVILKLDEWKKTKNEKDIKKLSRLESSSFLYLKTQKPLVELAKQIENISEKNETDNDNSNNEIVLNDFPNAIANSNILDFFPKKTDLRIDLNEAYDEQIRDSIEYEMETKQEFDDYMFSADVATPALEQPEIFNIFGSSSSLLNQSLTKTDSSKQTDTLNSTQESFNESPPTSSRKLKDNTMIYSLLAKKIKFNSKKS